MSLLNVEKSRQCGECDACRALHGSECQSPKDGSADLHPVSATAEQIGPRGIPILQGISDAERFEYEKRALSLEMRAIIQVVSMVRHARDDLRAYGEQVATLKAQLAAVTEERDAARIEAEKSDLQLTAWIRSTKAAEAALETCRLVGVSIVRRADCDGWAVTNQRACDAESVAAGANRALREALEAQYASCCGPRDPGGMPHAIPCDPCRLAAAALAAPPVADPRAEALASALESWVRVMDSMRADPDDPVTAIREQFHGKRLVQSRAALDAWRGTR